MNLHTLIFTGSDCYTRNRKIIPSGIMVHSTGANNPMLHRYVGPDDGQLGPNQYGNHWNQPGVNACPHAFIGKLQDGSIATYQVLPWDHRAWHCGDSANDTHISFEICEDGLEDGDYFNAVYREAVELCVYLCKMYGLTERDIICHSEGWEQGIASNHSDVMHWFPRHGKSMDTFRADVGAQLRAADDKLYKVQTGAFGDRDNADKLQADLREQGFDTYIVTIGNLYKVQVGAYRVRANADAMLAKLQATGCEDAFIVTEQDTHTDQPRPIAKGDLVEVVPGAKSYDGGSLSSLVWEHDWYVLQVTSDRVVIDKSDDGSHSICTPINVKDLRRV